MYHDNFQSGCITPLKLLNELYRSDLMDVYNEVVAALKIFLAIPVRAATGEKSFSKLALIKSDNRSVMTQERLNSLSTLNINCKLARSIDFTDLIKFFAKKQATRGLNIF